VNSPTGNQGDRRITDRDEGGDPYRKRLKELLPEIQNRFVWLDCRAPFLSYPEFKEALASSLRSYKSKLDEQLSHNLWRADATGTRVERQPRLISVRCTSFTKRSDMSDPSILRGQYVLGTHPTESLFVSSVGTQSKLIAYGNNRRLQLHSRWNHPGNRNHSAGLSRSRKLGPSCGTKTSTWWILSPPIFLR
jgi:hypothetical protein